MSAGSRPHRDAGQAFPLYITAVAALLFLALAFYAVGRAGSLRNSAQTAADAAALAAAQDYRDQLRTGFLAALGAGTGWADWLAGRGARDGQACAAADTYAGANGARPGVSCGPGNAPGSFTVTVTSQRTVGDSVVPGTQTRHATATAEAVVEPRCTAAPAPTAAPTPTPSASSTASPAPPTPGAPGGAVRLLCDGRVLVVGPGQPPAAVRAADLFTVRLTE
ncbi:pilus assembly protein TadG-related protein [Streptomyces sp. NPDC049555]|uniref:pilus assembly protein TadG-related protein n=1 Tax=Streptomyces sp. NPDC049555 TaxID=3154930 RepID=UPI003414051A